MSFSLFGFHGWRCCQRSAFAATLKHDFATQTRQMKRYVSNAASYNHQLPPHLHNQHQPEASTSASVLESPESAEQIPTATILKKRPRYRTEVARQTRKYDVSVSKRMRLLLGKTGKQHGLRVQPDGYIPIRELLKHPMMTGVTYETVERVVNEDRKERYQISWKPVVNLDCLYPGERESHTWWIKANIWGQPSHAQGNLERVYQAEDIPEAIYATNVSSWKRIGKEGIQRPCPSRLIPLHNQASALPAQPSSQILIFIDVARALASGINFYLESRKNRLYTEGNRIGILEPRFFKKVVKREVTDKVIHSEPEGEQTLSVA